MDGRFEIIKKTHALSFENYMEELRFKACLLYTGKHTYQKGTEFLASNEFDWYKTRFGVAETDSVIGFGTNSLWDISLMNRAKAMVIADWSPWPLIAHAFIFSPLIRIANSPQELVFMVSGLPGKYSYGLSLKEVFESAKKFTLSLINEQKSKVIELLNELAANPSISDLELKFLTTYYRPRLGDNLNPVNGYGPFYGLKSPDSANLTYYLEQRYNLEKKGQESSALSSPENFHYLKSLVQSENIYYAYADIMDIDFYKAVLQQRPFKNQKHFSLSFSNIFDCGHYNSLSLDNMFELLAKLKVIFASNNVLVYRTTGRDVPHEYLREVLL